VDATFDAVRVDRVLQHLEDPVRAFAEMVRVTRCGGRVVALEPDWYTATISGGDLAIAEAVRTCCARQRVRNGSIGRKLRDLFAATNCDDINVEPRVFWTSDLETADKVMSLQESLQLVVGEKIADASAAKTWWNALSESNAAGGLYCSVNIIIVGGTVRRP
jgi:ubiquinone/menaquinone biosynthesis C-methylase UbiE